MDTQATISIASINLEESHLRVLEFLISYYFKDRFSLTKKKDSKIQILYINSVNANKKIDKYQKKYPNSLFIIITNQTLENSVIPTVNLPVTPRKLSDALYQISHELESGLKQTLSKEVVSETHNNDILEETTPKNSSNNKNLKKKISKKERVEQHINIQKNTPLKESLTSGKTKKNLIQDKVKNNKKDTYTKPSHKSEKIRNKLLSKDSKIKEQKNKRAKKQKCEVVNDRNRVYTKEIKNLKKEINETIYKNNTPEKINKVTDNKIKPTLRSDSKKKEEYDFYLDLDNYVEDRARKHLENKTLPKNNKKKDNQNKNQNTKKTIYSKKHIAIARDKLNFMSSRPDIDLNNTNLISKISYDPNSYLQGYLNVIYKSPRLNSVDVLHGIITYNKENHTAFINVNNRTLQNISSIGKLKTHYSLVDINDLCKDETIVWEDADTVLWKVTIWASRGRLPHKFNDIDVKFKLKYWPNLTRFMMTPHAMEIAALWLNKPISLRKSVILLNIPQRYVFSFYSAAIALNLIVFEKNVPLEKPISHSTKSIIKHKTKRKGVFGKLLTYFKPNNIEEI